MGGIYDGPWNHDCGWIECTPLDCEQSRFRASEGSLIRYGINRDGTKRGGPDSLPSEPLYAEGGAGNA